MNAGRVTCAALVLLIASAASSQYATMTEPFDSDPGWAGVNCAPPEGVGKEKRQDFAYRTTNLAGGVPGELGGWMYRSLTPCYLAMPIPEKTLEQPLYASGKFAVTASQSSSGVLIGWFNSASRGWRTANSLAFRIDGEGNTYRIFFEYGTRHNFTGGGTTFEGAYQTTKTPMHKADGTVHEWSLEYMPDGADGLGALTFTMDGIAYHAALETGHKEDGAVFDRFGVFNQQISGNGLECHLDDLRIDGQSYTFDVDPRWEGLNNQLVFVDRALRPYHDFGWRNSRRAGGAPGEIGGLVWRIESTRPQEAMHYGAPVGPLTLEDTLEASGRVALCLASADSAALIGWYNHLTPIGAPPANFLGVLIEGPSRVGHYFRPALGASDDTRAVLDEGPLIQADAAPHVWRLVYRPERNDGNGAIEVSLDDKTAVLPLPEVARKGGAAFDRFGVLSWHRGGHCVEMYFDDLTFTSARQEQRDSAPDAPLNIGSEKQLLFDSRFVARSEHVQTVANPPRKAGVVLEADAPWEDFRLTSYFTVLQDGDLCRMYYSCFSKDQWHTPNAWEEHAFLCYAESQDGVHWVKPKLGIVAFDGSTANNILMRSVVDGTVFVDPNAPPEKRYKMLHTVGPHAGGLRVSYSADGVHFTTPEQPVSPWCPDSQQNAFWDARRGEYAAYLRGRPDMGLDAANRLVVRAAMNDIETPWDARPEIVLQTDARDLPTVDFYTNACVLYPYAQDAYFMFPAAYHHFPPEKGNDGLLDTHIAASRDGVRWERPDRRAYVPLGEAAEWDASFVMMGVGLVRRGNELYQYYNGVDLSHGGTRGMDEAERGKWRRWGKIGRTVQRLDGFYSIDADYTGGWFETPTLVFKGDHLELNINTTAAGMAHVALLDAAGKPIDGYSLKECDDIFTNEVAHTVTWRGNPDVSPLAGTPIRLRFEMRAAKLHAFQFVMNERREL